MLSPEGNTNNIMEGYITYYMCAHTIQLKEAEITLSLFVESYENTLSLQFVQ